MSYRLQKLMTLIVVMSMLGVLLAACGGGEETGADQAPVAEPEEGAAAPEVEEEVAASPADRPEVEEEAAAAPEDVEEELGASPAAGAEAAGSEFDAATACPDAAQGQRIEMWSPLTGPDGDEMTALAQQFSQENPLGIQVSHVAQPEYLRKLTTAATGGNLPEMTVIRVDDIAEMAARNVLKPMNDDLLNIIGGENIAAAFPEQVWNAGEFRDQRFAFPLDVHPLVLYYNKDLFEQAGIPAPGETQMSREKFDQALQTLEQETDAMPIAIGTAFQAATLFQTLVRQFGGRLVNEEGTEATFNSEAGVQALQYLNELKQQYSPEISGAGDPEVVAFQQGRAAMVIHGPWHISNLQRLPFTGFAPVPQIGDEYAVWAGSHQLALTTDDQAKQAAAACWIGWLSANSVQWAQAGQVPIRQSEREGGQLEEVAPPVSQIAGMADDVIILPTSIPGLGTALWGEGFGPVVDAVLLGKQQDIQQALDQAAARSNQIIEQNQQRYGGAE